jgi:hypothetical protein
LEQVGEVIAIKIGGEIGRMFAIQGGLLALGAADREIPWQLFEAL